MNWFGREKPSGLAEALFRKLREERIVWDLDSTAEIEVLRRDVARIASDMESPDRPPPMYWSGIPWPEPGPEPSCDYHLVVSVGGTKTDFALLRLERGRVLGLDVETGREVSDPDEIDRVKQATQAHTPKYGPETPSGLDMIAQLVRHFARHLGQHREALSRCQGILLSWGFAHRVIRTGPRLAGGLSARVTKMTKDQFGFTPQLAGKDIGVLFGRELESQLGWSRPIAVANDTVMALHYFLAPVRRAGHARVGLFINGTGTNFAAAEAYAVRPEGFISREGEDYAPERLTVFRALKPGERRASFFVNYESGSIELGATRTRFDVDREYPIERNALAGGNAFGQSLRGLLGELVSHEAYERIRDYCAREQKDPLPGAPLVSALATTAGVHPALKGAASPEELAQQARLVSRAIIARSALHAALVLAAVTRRTGFGKGAEGLPDLLGMEGSVWKIPGYQELVRGFWQALLGKEQLSVDFAAEPAYNASVAGPLYLAAIHR